MAFTTTDGHTSGASGRTEKRQFIHREISFVEYAQEFLSYGSTCSNNCYVHFMRDLNTVY